MKQGPIKFTVRPPKARHHRALFEEDQYRPRTERPKTEYRRRPKHRQYDMDY